MLCWTTKIKAIPPKINKSTMSIFTMVFNKLVYVEAEQLHKKET